MGLAKRVEAWVGRPDISARSVIVTLLGDSIAPLGGTVWLGDLFELLEPFGFAERLLRTSMYRLATEGWVDSERVGRRSRYSLTPFAHDEFLEADRRIYRSAGAGEAWGGRWAMVLVNAATVDPEARARIVNHLRWRGYGELSRGVWVVPDRDDHASADLEHLFQRLEIPTPPPVADATFTDLPGLVDAGVFAASFDLAEPEAHYHRFLDQHRWAATVGPDDLTPVEALTLRTMLVHDLRRARLTDPDLPSAALAPGWVGAGAVDLAATVHRVVDGPAWAAVEAVTGLSRAGGDERLARRFQ